MDQYGILSLVADGFESPSGLCWDDGALYVADTGNHRICKVEQGLVSILAGGKVKPDRPEVKSLCVYDANMPENYCLLGSSLFSILKKLSHCQR